MSEIRRLGQQVGSWLRRERRNPPPSRSEPPPVWWIDIDDEDDRNIHRENLSSIPLETLHRIIVATRVRAGMLWHRHEPAIEELISRNDPSSLPYLLRAHNNYLKGQASTVKSGDYVGKVFEDGIRKKIYEGIMINVQTHGLREISELKPEEIRLLLKITQMTTKEALESIEQEIQNIEAERKSLEQHERTLNSSLSPETQQFKDTMLLIKQQISDTRTAINNSDNKLRGLREKKEIISLFNDATLGR